MKTQYYQSLVVILLLLAGITLTSTTVTASHGGSPSFTSLTGGGDYASNDTVELVWELSAASGLNYSIVMVKDGGSQTTVDSGTVEDDTIAFTIVSIAAGNYTFTATLVHDDIPLGSSISVTVTSATPVESSESGGLPVSAVWFFLALPALVGIRRRWN